MSATSCVTCTASVSPTKVFMFRSVIESVEILRKVLPLWVAMLGVAA